MAPDAIAMSRRTFSLLILSILLCCNGWAAAVQDVLQVRAGLVNVFDEAGQAQVGEVSYCAQDNANAGTHHKGAAGELNIDDAVMAGLPDLRCAEVAAPAFHHARRCATPPSRWLERPMRPPCPAARFT